MRYRNKFIYYYRKSSIKPPGGAYLFQAHLRQPRSQGFLLPALQSSVGLVRENPGNVVAFEGTVSQSS